MPDGIQRYSRTKMVLPLRVWLDERVTDTTPWQWAHTVDTCEVGCRIGGMRTELCPGQIITVQRGQHRACFRVIWNKTLAPNENQAGIEALHAGVNIWSVNTQPSTDAGISPAIFAPVVPSALSASSVSVPKVSAPRVSLPNISAEQKTVLAAAHRRLRLALSFGFLLLSLALGLILYHQLFRGSERVEIEPPLPIPPSARELARLTPKPHPMPVSLTKPLDASTSRLQVAEAPTGRLVYPVPPDDSIRGRVHLQIVVASNGLVKQIHVLSGKQPLAEAAAQAVRLWHYASLQGPDRATERDRETSVTVSFLGTDAVSLEFPSSSSSAQLSANRPVNN